MVIETLGIDIAKNVFQLHGVGRNGQPYPHGPAYNGVGIDFLP